MRRIVFLDFDGVTNSGDAFVREQAQFGRHYSASPHCCYTVAFPEHVRHLNAIQEAVPDVEWALSSTHRLLRPLEENQRNLDAAGFAGKLVGRTACPANLSEAYGAQPRGVKISQWLARNVEESEERRFVILDDDDDMDGVMSALVQTDANHGLLEEHAAETIRRLRS